MDYHSLSNDARILREVTQLVLRNNAQYAGYGQVLLDDRAWKTKQLVEEAMRQTSEIRELLRKYAQQISRENGEAPVVVILGGSEEASIPRCVTASANLVKGREGHLRDLVGILQTAIQIESFEHLHKQMSL